MLRLRPLVLSCVGERRQADVPEVVELSELTVAEVEAEMVPPLVVSCVGGNRSTEVVEVTMLVELAVARLEAATRR